MISQANTLQEQVDRNIEILRTELPTFFDKDVSYDIYTKDILFEDPINRLKGKLSYRIAFWTLRFHGGLFFTEVHFDLHDVKQESAQQIRADWTIRGKLLLPWKTQLFFNGSSIYYMNDQGLIYHHVDTWDREPLAILKQFLPNQPQPN
ncbi:MAG: DUF2358 domain-containing protein [Cyanobacteria bacterium P01_G01_bin.54]